MEENWYMINRGTMKQSSDSPQKQDNSKTFTEYNTTHFPELSVYYRCEKERRRKKGQGYR